MKKKWLEMWDSNPPSVLLLSISTLIALLMSIPLIYIIIRALQGSREKWLRLIDQQIPDLLFNTFSLAILVTVAAIAIGVALAWLVVRTDLPGKRIWRWLLAIPLVVPTYVGALSYIMTFGPVGWLKEIFNLELFSIYSFFGVVLVLTIFTYPYVYLIVSSALKRLNPHYEEAALSCGVSYKRVFFKIIIPMLRPSIGAGGFLVALYVLADFGAIAMLRYNTFASRIFFQVTGRFDREGAAILSLILIVITLIILWFEYKSREKAKYYQNNAGYEKPETVKLKKWRLPALFFVIAIVILGVGLPIITLLGWSIRGIAAGVLSLDFIGYTFNSFISASIAALLAMALSLPVVYLKSRHPAVISKVINNLAYAGYISPGVIIALGIIFIFNQYLNFLYGSLLMLILAYVIRFLPQNMQAVEASLDFLPPQIDEAARGLGSNSFSLLRKVILPTIMPGVLAGGALVFVNSLKELTTALMLRPIGFDTLAIRVWIDAHEGFYESAALPALLIIIVAVLPLNWLLKKY